MAYWGNGVEMNKYKYQFKVSKINLTEKHFKDEYKDFASDKDLLSLITKTVGTPITILIEDPEDFPNQGTFFAKHQAEDKASEIIATLMGITYGGSQKHMKNYAEDAELKGKFVQCELLSIEQID